MSRKTKGELREVFCFEGEDGSGIESTVEEVVFEEEEEEEEECGLLL